jgi:hypothetical protein
MSIPGVIVTITLACIAWSLWVRRITWASRWESAATLSITLQGSGLLLTTPVGSATVGRVLHWATTEPHLEKVIGHMCLILAAAAIVYSVLDRIYDDDSELSESFKLWVEKPVTLTVAALLVVFSAGGIGAATVLLCGTLAYLLAYACRALLILRRDRKQRRVADLYLIACSSGVLACVSRMVMTVLPPENTICQTIMWLPLSCAWLAGFALVSGYSWAQKRRPFRKHEETLG